jgi:hypothetical protein
MAQIDIKPIINKSFKNFLKELDQIKLEIARSPFSETENSTGKKDEKTRKSKSE